MKIEQLQFILIIVIFSLMIVIPILMIAQYRSQNKKNNEKHERELKAIIEKWGKKD